MKVTKSKDFDGAEVTWSVDPADPQSSPRIEARKGLRKLSVYFVRSEFDACMEFVGPERMADEVSGWCELIAARLLRRGDA
jgi:hypothetical protein